MNKITAPFLPIAPTGPSNVGAKNHVYQRQGESTSPGSQGSVICPRQMLPTITAMIWTMTARIPMSANFVNCFKSVTMTMAENNGNATAKRTMRWAVTLSAATPAVPSMLSTTNCKNKTMKPMKLTFFVTERACFQKRPPTTSARISYVDASPSGMLSRTSQAWQIMSPHCRHTKAQSASMASAGTTPRSAMIFGSTRPPAPIAATIKVATASFWVMPFRDIFSRSSSSSRVVHAQDRPARESMEAPLIETSRCTPWLSPLKRRTSRPMPDTLMRAAEVCEVGLDTGLKDGLLHVTPFHGEHGASASAETTPSLSTQTDELILPSVAPVNDPVSTLGMRTSSVPGLIVMDSHRSMAPARGGGP
mmetsp:Transcript_43831/g.132779  ORF Transcript_43831/g.132779 Transcript_43831/m.132779 type:complete len:363 (-) Transcript_43831:52-1140(-)